MKVSRSESFKHIELTKEELDEAIYKAKKAKNTRLEREAYLRKLTEPVSYPSFNAEQFFKIIEKKAFATIPGFVMDNETKGIIETLCLYFTSDEGFEMLNEDYSLNKGICLYGNIGVGKTTLMRLFCENQLSSYVVLNCSTIADDYAKNGVNEFDLYEGLYRSNGTIGRVFGHTDLGICFDDLGSESLSKNFGNERNVMQEILTRRYNNIFHLQNKTHITTNQTPDELERMYGLRIRNRMKEMFNVITFSEKSKSKRK